MKKIKPIAFDEPVNIKEAYDILPATTFAAYIRLMVTSTKERTGWKSISKILGCTEYHAQKLLHTLKRAGFIDIIKLKNGKYIRVKIRKRVIISGKNKFIRLS